MNEQTIEQEIQDKGKTAPRITPAGIEAEIVSEHYFTAEQGAFAAFYPPRGSDTVSLTDTALNEAKMKTNDLNPNDKWFEGSVMFVNLETDKGTLQFVTYNEHNGYYGHVAKVQCTQLTHAETL